MSTVIRHVVESISAGSRAQAMRARELVGRAHAPLLERLAATLAGAQHAAQIRTARRTLVIVAGDHGAGDPGIDLGDAHPTGVLMRAIADGSAAVSGVARGARLPIVLVDAGAATTLPAVAVRLSGRPSRDLRREPAMTVVDATLGIEAGIALAVSLAEQGLDLLALGAVGLGSEGTAAALLAATGSVGVELDAEAVAAGRTHATSHPLERLAALGGPDTCVLAGAILGAASMNIPVIVDGPATCAAALAAHGFAPAVADSLVAAQGGAPLQRALLARLGLEPIFEVGLGHGEGIGAAMVLPLVDQVAALLGT